MKISYNWLKNYINVDLSAERTAEILTDTGLEVEGLTKVEAVKGGLEGLVIGHVLTKEKHPDADRLNITTVDIGQNEPLQIVCGAPNVEAGQKVVVATVGATLYPSPEESFKIKKSKIRGVESVGMICAEDEIGLGEGHDGIMVLEPNAEVGAPAATFFDLSDDYLIEIGLTPNRADAMGHIGVARDLKAYLNYHDNTNITLTIPADKISSETAENVNINIADTDGCPRYAGTVITDVKVADSPEWLQTKLRAIGLNPINNIVDVTNFVMHETGNPLHAFDLANVDGEINVRRATKGEKLTTLDEVERELSESDLVIANATVPMCLAGVFGGLNSGVKSSTTGIFLEAAYFNPVSIRKSAKKQALNTDSSFRFERGVDPNNVIAAMHRAAHLIKEIAGGKIGAITDNYPAKINDFEVVFSFDRCRKLCGITVSDEEIVKILNELDITVVSDSEEEVVLNVPAYRVDVQREADIIEEVLRIYGFNQVPIPAKLNSSLSYRPKPDSEKIYAVTADLLASNGFSEIMNNSLTSSAYIEKLNSETVKPLASVAILNPLSNELDVMRQTLLFGGLKSIEHNQNRQHPDIQFFELGSTYKVINGVYQQEKRLALWMCGQKEAESWNSSNDKVNFYGLKGTVEAILTKLGINKAPRTSAVENDLFADGYAIKVANKIVAELGWVKPAVCKQFGVKQVVYYAELNWDVVMELAIMNKINFKPIPKTQFVRRDFSLLLDKSITFAEIQSIAQKADRKVLKEVDLFDVYEGKNVDNDKKSYAVSFIFQDDEKTLKDKQVDAIMEKIRTNLEKKLGAKLR